MRFSLATLILAVLFISALIVVWVQREPWVPSSPVAVPKNTPDMYFALSPDKKRRVEIRHVDEFPDAFWLVLDAPGSPDDGRLILDIPGNFLHVWFEDDDTLAAVDYEGKLKYYHRRFPEWWWGQFHRPEVWIAIATGVALMWRLIARRTRNRR